MVFCTCFVAGLLGAGNDGQGRLFAETEVHDAAEIRHTAETILASPEFRHLQRLKDLEQSDEGDDLELRTRGESNGRGGTARGRARGSGESRGTPSEERDSSETSPRNGDTEARGFTLPAGLQAVSSVLGPLLHVLAWLALAVVCGVIVFLVIRAISKADRSIRRNESSGEGQRAGEAEPEHAPGQVPADVYLTRARRLAAEGKFREAIAHLLLGAMSHIERAGRIRYRRSLTHRDYLRAVRAQPQEYDALKSLVGVYEPIGFGRRPATQDHFEHSLAQYETGFHASGSFLER